MSSTGWVGVDLDGTLAHYDGWKGPDHIGDPIPNIVARVVSWLDKGIDVRIFTARASDPEQVPFVKDWVIKHIGRPLPITNVKDFSMILLIDDRCVRVIANTGNACCGSLDLF